MMWIYKATKLAQRKNKQQLPAKTKNSGVMRFTTEMCSCKYINKSMKSNKNKIDTVTSNNKLIDIWPN